MEKTITLGKRDGSRKKGRPKMRWIDFIEDATGAEQEGEDRALWMSLGHRVARSRDRLDGM